MNNNTIFNLPQKLDSLGYVINILRTFVAVIKNFIFFIVYLLYKYRDNLNLQYLSLFLFAFILVVTVISLINFRSFRYYVNDETSEFIVKKGFLSKSKVVIKLSNILQVNITQNVLQKALSLYSLTLDTAGSDAIEADLYALSEVQANDLRTLLLSRISTRKGVAQKAIDQDQVDASSLTERIVSLSAKNILLVSLLSNYRQGLALFIAFSFSIFQNFKDILEVFESDYQDASINFIEEKASSSLFMLILIVVVGFITIPFVMNIIRYYFKYYNFSIIRNPVGNFSMQYGLLKQVHKIFNKEKVKLISFRQNRILKRLGIGILSLEQLVVDVAKIDRSTIELPGVSVEDKDKVYCLAFGDSIFVNQKVLKASFGLFINRSLKTLLVFILIFLLIYFLDLSKSYSFPLAILLLGFGFLYNYLYYRGYSLVYNESFIIKRYGVWNEKELVIPMNRVQAIDVSQTIFQRRTYTSNLKLSTAAKSVRFDFFDQKDINDMANYILYVVEK